MTEIQEELNALQFVTQHDVKHSSTLLRSIVSMMYDENSLKIVMAHISKCLANASTREIGFEILLKVLPDIPEATLHQHMKNWTTVAVSKHESELIAPCRFQFFVEIYHNCYGSQEFHKLIVSNLLPKIIDTCLWTHPKSPNAVHALNCLYHTMCFFASTCITYKKRIDDFIMEFLDMPVAHEIAIAAGKCYLALSQIGGAGPNGSVHIQNFETSFKKLYNTLNVLYDAMFESIYEFSKTSAGNESNVIQFRELPTYLSTVDVYRTLSRRMANVTVFLIQMLQIKYPVRKTIQPRLLTIIQRGLDIHVHAEANNATKIFFNECIQEHQMNLIHLMKALIICVQHNLMRHMVLQVIVRYLTRISECSCYKVDFAFKCSIYYLIDTWLMCSGEQMDQKTFATLIDVIIKDITPNTPVIQLQIQNKNNSKAASDVNQAQVAEHTQRILETKEENCKAALQLLEHMLVNVHMNIHKATWTKVFNVLINTFTNICANIYTAPYTTQLCRLRLAKVFIATFIQHRQNIDIDLAINLLYMGQCDIDTEFSIICQNGLKIIEKIVHPILPTMELPREAEDKPDNLENRPKERNAAVTVLKNLLLQSGNSKSTNQQNETEVMNKTQTDSTENDTVRNDNFVETDGVIQVLSDNEADGDVTIVDHDSCAIPAKRRKASDDDVIITFDISDDPLESFVNEID